MGLFSPTSCKKRTCEPFDYMVESLTPLTDGKQKIIKVKPQVCPLSYKDCCLSSQVRDGVQLVDVNPSSYIKQDIDTISVQLQKASEIISNEEIVDVPETPETPETPTTE